MSKEAAQNPSAEIAVWFDGAVYRISESAKHLI